MREFHTRALRLPSGLTPTSRVDGAIQVPQAFVCVKSNKQYWPKDLIEAVADCDIAS